MQSIGKAQAELLASGFLQTLGANPEFNDLELNESLVALIMLAGTLIKEASNNLERGGNISSGALASSLKVLDPQMFGKSIRLDVEALKYYQYINKGVRGVKGGQGDYSFKNPFPSAAMVKAIEDWMSRGHMGTRNIKKSVSRHERKGQSISQLSSAYAVARSIKMHGIKKTGFFDKAVAVAQSEAKDELSKALKVDIINSLPKQL